MIVTISFKRDKAVHLGKLMDRNVLALVNVVFKSFRYTQDTQVSVGTRLLKLLLLHMHAKSGTKYKPDDPSLDYVPKIISNRQVGQCKE